jgi:uncharacterized protein (DUF58 family)
MAALLFAGLLRGRRECFALFFIMLFVALYALALNLWTALSFSYVQELAAPSSVKGAATSLKIGVFNDKPFPFTLMRIRVETVLPDKNYALLFSLSPQSHIVFTVPVLCPYRGIYKTGMTLLEINDIFGLVKTRLDMRKLSYYRRRELKIFPRLVELPHLAALTADAKFSGGAMRISEQGDTYSELRKYRPGDAIKRVHAAVSLKRRELFVKTYDTPLETAALVAIDTSLAVDSEPARYLADIACECAAAIISCGLRSGFAVELAGHSRVSASDSGRGFFALYNTLATMAFGGGDLAASLAPAARAGGYKAAYIISHCGPGAYAAALQALRNSGCCVSFLRVSHSGERLEGDSSVPGVPCTPLTPADDVGQALRDILR